jgi:hypothetical protein
VLLLRTEYASNSSISLGLKLSSLGKFRVHYSWRRVNSKWYLDLNGNGKLDNCTKDRCLGQFGQPDGDWAGTGKARIGVFDASTGMWS